MATFTTTEIPYGSNFLQRADLLIPDGAIKGVVVWIHGGGWAGGAKSATGFSSQQAAFTNNDYNDIKKVAEAGYVLINCAYRLTSPASDGFGGDRTGGYPNAIIDIETILSYCMVNGAGAAASVSWQTIYNYVNIYGLLVTGSSAGGHLAVQAVGKYGTSSGLWPRAVLNVCGPMDLVYNNTDIIISPALQTAVNLFSDPSDVTGSTKNTNNLIAASPKFQYGTSAAPGSWYNALNASSCKFYFIQNTNDTLVTSVMVTPFINSLPPSKVFSSTVTEGTVIPGVENHNFTSTGDTFVISMASSVMSTAPFPPSAYVSFVGVTNTSGLDWVISEELGSTVTFTLNTTNGIPAGTVLYWTTLASTATINASDFTDGQIQGTVTVGINGTSTIIRNARADLTTEGSELFRLEIRETSYTSPVVITSDSSVDGDFIGIGDTSVSITYNSFVGVTDYSAGSTTLLEGQFTATFTLTTAGATTGTTVYWTTLGSVTYGTMTTDDFADGQLQGTATIGSNGIATITRTARADLFTEDSEVFYLEIRETGYTGPVKITSGGIGIADTSTTPPPSPLSYTSFVGVTNDSTTNWYIGEALGGTVTFTLTTTGGTPGTVVYWTTLSYVGSITAADFTDNTLEGSVTIASNGITTITRTARADAFTEGSEAFKLEIREDSMSGAVKIVSTSSNNTSAIWIGDSSTTPVAAPTYAVSAAASSVDEGSAITFTVTTANVAEATQLYWSLSNTTDFATSSGTVVISGTTGSFSVIPQADATTEATAETFTASISTTEGGAPAATSGSVTINDTSQTPSTPTYTVAAAGGVTSVNEGVGIAFTVTTTNVTNGTVLNWAVSNAGDFNTSSGTVAITTTGTNGTGSFSVTPRADTTTENTPETFIASIYTGSIAGTPVATSGSITINDTSQTPALGITYVSLVPSGGLVSSYEVPLTPDGSIGPSAVSFVLTTTGAADGTVVYWTTTGYLGSTPSAGDFTDNTLQGTATIIDNKVTIVRTARQDYTTEELYEYYKLEIRETGYINDVKIISQYVALVDGSQPPTDVTITPTTSSVDEGASLLCTVTTVGLLDYSVLYWSVSNSGDFAVSNGSFTIVSNTGSFSVTPRADTATEGVETFTISILSDSINGLFSPTVFKTSDPITINDTSLTGSYSITPSATSVNEGTKIDFTVNTTNVTTGTVLYWSVSNSGDFSNSAGQVTIQEGTVTVFSVTPVLDYVTETPAETFTASISLTSGGASVFTTGAITINDIAAQPVYTITPVINTVTEGAALRFDISTTNVPVNTILYWTVTNPVAAAVPPTPVYVITPAASSVNEGASLTFNVSGSNIPNGTHYWTIGTNSGDFGVTSGSFTIDSNAGFFDVSPTADTATEGAETFTVTVRTGSIIGTPVVTTNPAITINDTSLTPPVPVYTAVTPATNSVNEGSPLTFTVTTANVINGTVLYWTLNPPGEFEESSGTVTITSDRGTFSVTPLADTVTEGAEQFTVSIRTNSVSGLVEKTSGVVTINDTSTTPIQPLPPTYAVAAAGNSVNEGSALTFTVTTANVANGTVLYWAVLTNANDFAVSNGSVTITTTGTNGTGSFSVTPQADATTEGTETFTVGIRSTAISVDNVVVSDPITINDTSTTPLPVATYAVTPAVNSVNEGTALLFTVTTANVANGTVLNWAVTNAGDFAISTGTVTITTTGADGTGQFSVTPLSDITTEGAEIFTASVYTGTITGTPVATSSVVTINDTSTTPLPPPSATYAVAPVSFSINEGTELTFTVTTTDLVDNTTLYWSITSASDFGISSGTVAIVGNTGTFRVTPILDTTTEGPETFTASIRTISSSGTIVATSNPVTINDTSTTPPVSTPTYAVAAAAGAVNEGTALTFTVTTTSVADATVLYWTVSNSGDFGTSSGVVVIVDNTANLTVTPALDLTTEGSESFILELRVNSADIDPVAVSTSVLIIDTSQGPPPPALPEYVVLPAALSVNEGSPLIIVVNTVNVENATRLYWSVSNAGDFATPLGSFLITDNSGSFSVTPTQDNTVEPAESFVVTIRTVSASGAIVGNSPPITINATAPTSQLFATKITPTVYNNARTQVAGVLGTTTTGQIGATQGYGQSLASAAVSQHEKVTETQLDNLRLDIVKTRTHQSDVAPDLVNVAVGNLAQAEVFDLLLVSAQACNTLRDQVGPNQLTTVTYTQTETYSAYTGTANTGGGWKNYAFYELAVTFATADDARYFFNAGSSFKFSASREGGTVAPTVGLNQNTSWTTLLLGVTAENPSFARSEFYALSNSYSTVYNRNSTGIYSANYYRISAKSNVAANANGGATVVTFKIEFVDAFNDGNTTNYDGVDGTFVSSVVRSMTKGVGLGGAIFVAAPTAVTATPTTGLTENGVPIYITANYTVTATPTSVSEANATINFTFAASNYNVPNTVTWFIRATATVSLLDFVETGWTATTDINGYKILSRRTNLSSSSTFAASVTTASIVTNPDALTEGSETFIVTAVPDADGSGGGIASNEVEIVITDSSKTATPGYTVSPPTVVGSSAELSCIPGEGLGAPATWRINSVALTGSADLIIYGIYLDISTNTNINAYSMVLWDNTVLTETTTTFYTLPTAKSVANGSSLSFTVRVGSTSGGAGVGSVRIRIRTNAGTADGSGPNPVGPSFNSAIVPVSTAVIAATISLTMTANPSSVAFYYVTPGTGSGTTTISVTNTGNARATLQNYNVSNPGGSVSPGSLAGLILAGASQTTLVTYSSNSAFSGNSFASITGINSLVGTVSANRTIAVTATQAFGIISASFASASEYIGTIYQSRQLVVNIQNTGLAPLTVTNVTVNNATAMTFSPTSVPVSISIQPGSAGQQFNFTWLRSRIGSSTVTVSITSNTGGVAGTITSISNSFTATATTPTFTLSGSGSGAVVGTSWTVNDGVLLKENSVRLEFAGLEPLGPIMAALFWTQSQNDQGTGGIGGWAVSESRPGGQFIRDPKQVPISLDTASISASGTFVAWQGTDPIETRYWRAGRNRFYVQLPIGKTDSGVQQWYTNARSGTSAAAANQWATNAALPEAACGTNQTWIGFTLQPNLTWSFSSYVPVQGDTVTYSVQGAASDVNVSFGTLGFSDDNGRVTNSATPTRLPSVFANGQGIASGTFSTSALGVGTYYVVFPISPSGHGVFPIAQPTLLSELRDFDVLSPALFAVADNSGGQPFQGKGVSFVDTGTYGTASLYYWRRTLATNGTYPACTLFIDADDSCEVWIQGIWRARGQLGATTQTVHSVTVNDGFAHWKFLHNNITGPTWFAVSMYVPFIPGDWVSNEYINMRFPVMLAASKW